MGLDMYLKKRTYVRNWDYQTPEERHTITVKKGGKPTKIKPERIYEIVELIGYWRKANAIHAWFVANVQKGEDDCGEYHVSAEKLGELLALCQRVLAVCKLVDGKVVSGYQLVADAGRGFDDRRIVKKPIVADGEFIENPNKAIQLLPTQAGFFFGSTDYDQGYYQDIEDTVKILQEALSDPSGDYYYDSSW